MRSIILIFLLSLFITGCVDLDVEEMWFIDTVSVSPDGKIALCLNDSGDFFWAGEGAEVYITDFQGSSFTRVTENEVKNSSVTWSGDGKCLLYIERTDEVWKLNLYSFSERLSINILQEMYYIALPSFSYDKENIAYMVFPDEEAPVGHLNIYDKDSSSVYTLIDSAYYDYKWIPEAKKIVALNVTEGFEEIFKGRLIVKDIQGFTEDVIFNGYFLNEGNAMDISRDGRTIIFSASDEESSKVDIYLYNIEDEALTKWSGPEGYEFRLPAAGLGGYILAYVKGQEDEWGEQLYLVSLDKKIIEVPGWPVWIKHPHVVCFDLYEGMILVLNLDTSEIVNLTEKFLEYYGTQED